MKQPLSHLTVYQSLFNHPAIVQAMLIFHGQAWRYHARLIRDQHPHTILEDESVRLIQETINADAVEIERFWGYDYAGEFRLRLMQFGELFLVQRQNGNILWYFESQADAREYTKGTYVRDLKAFDKEMRKLQKMDRSGLEPPHR